MPTEFASMVTFPPENEFTVVPDWIEAPSTRVTVLAWTATSPARAEPKVSEMMPEFNPERTTESAMLPAPCSPCTVSVEPTGALRSELAVPVEMVAPPERLACWTLTTTSPPRPTSAAIVLMAVPAPSIVKDLDVMATPPHNTGPVSVKAVGEGSGISEKETESCGAGERN